MTGSHRSTFIHVANTRLTYIETEIRLSASLSLTSRAIIQDLSEDNPHHLDRLVTVILTAPD